MFFVVASVPRPRRIGSVYRDAHFRVHHVGLNVDDFDAVYWRASEQRLRDDSAFFSGMYELPDGSVQMYLRDPAGNLVEVDWPDARTFDARIREDLIPLTSTVHQPSDALRATLYLDGPDGTAARIRANPKETACTQPTTP